MIKIESYYNTWMCVCVCVCVCFEALAVGRLIIEEFSPTFKLVHLVSASGCKGEPRLSYWALPLGAGTILVVFCLSCGVVTLIVFTNLSFDKI
jgi:hypothetical protein